MVLGFVLALGLSQSVDSSAVRELEGIEQQLAATWKADCAGWGALLAPEWSVIHITAEIMTKPKALEMCKAPREGTMDQKFDELSIRVFGDSAIVTGRNTVSIGGAKPSTLTLRFTDVFVRRAGRWLVVASHATQLGS